MQITFYPEYQQGILRCLPEWAQVFKLLDNVKLQYYNSHHNKAGGMAMEASFREKEAKLFHDLKVAFNKSKTIPKYCLKWKSWKGK